MYLRFPGSISRTAVAGSGIFLLIAVFYFGRTRRDSQQWVSVVEHDLVSGPRCVAFVLKWYGIDQDLMKLVREIQWPELENGCSLADIAAAVEARGIHTQALVASPRAKILWRYPVVVQLTEPSEVEGFAVLLPTASTHKNLLLASVNGMRFVTQQGCWKYHAGNCYSESPCYIKPCFPLVPLNVWVCHSYGVNELVAPYWECVDTSQDGNTVCDEDDQICNELTRCAPFNCDMNGLGQMVCMEGTEGPLLEIWAPADVVDQASLSCPLARSPWVPFHEGMALARSPIQW